MTTQNYTLRLTDEWRAWLERNDLPKSRQLIRDLDNLRILISMATRDDVRHHRLRDVAEALHIIPEVKE